MDERARALTRRLVLVFVAVAAWAALGTGVRATYGARTTADEPEYLLTALSLAEDRSLDVNDERTAQRYRPFHEAPLLEQSLRQDDGSRISPHDPLLPALLAVPMGLGGWVLAKLTLAAMAGLLAAAMVWVAVRRFGVTPGLATLTVLAFALAPPLAVYGTQVYPEVPAALAVVAAIACLTGPLRRWGIVGAAAAVVALPWLAVKYVPVAAVLGAALLARRRALWLVGAFAAAGVAYLVAHRVWYGGWTVYAAGDHFVGGEFTAVGTETNLAGRSVRLVGLLVDREFGLAVWQPLYLLAPLALGVLVRRRAPGWAVLVAVLAAGWLNATFAALTMHGFWWPGRQVVVVLPVVVLAVAWWAARSVWARRLVWVGAVVGATAYGWLVVEGLARRLTWVFDFATTTNPVVRGVRVVLPDYRDLSAAGWALHALWVVAVLALLVLRPPEGSVLGSPNYGEERATDRDGVGVGRPSGRGLR